jgi:hypothetical protein
MVQQGKSYSHIEITETIVRLYVFLTQYLDRCLDEAARTSYPEEELHAHLSATRKQMMEILTVNPVVKGKVEKECERALSLGAACLKAGAERAASSDAVKVERAVFRNKTIALSDILAVFRAL